MDVEVEREVEVEAPAGTVWEALVEPGGLEGWFGTASRLDPVPGGRALFWDDHEVRFAEVVEAEPGRRLSWRWWPAGETQDRAGTVAVDLAATGERTVVRVVERPAQPAARSPRALAMASPGRRAPQRDRT